MFQVMLDIRSSKWLEKAGENQKDVPQALSDKSIYLVVLTRTTVSKQERSPKLVPQIHAQLTSKRFS